MERNKAVASYPIVSEIETIEDILKGMNTPDGNLDVAIYLDATRGSNIGIKEFEKHIGKEGFCMIQNLTRLHITMLFEKRLKELQKQLDDL